MKKFFKNRELERNFAGFEVLISDELLQVRGGGDSRPETKPLDFFDLEKT